MCGHGWLLYGMDSHFASALIGKILRKVIIETGYRELYEKNVQYPLEEELKDIIRNLFREISSVKKNLMLDEKELLSTLTVLLYHIRDNRGIVLTIGDGVVCIDGKITAFDHDNKPDYLAFHLSENFEEWYDQLPQKILFDNIKDISIATDGILTFSKIKKTDAEESIHSVDYLMKDRSYNDTEEMLNRKLKTLENHYQLRPTDDLAIIRIIKE
ncbi:MAG: hypothetical protein MUW56_15730 [Chryseobacterium sp.]|uniref:protein phosphatase 2C domain-containing protein n=1 Tax=Chryseobacterium sp. TaxID=1871047 RepID=UPI0025C1C75C|nr:protein phosphatase 2C domain-containing protein [Chryseobacterium sp.]MCJ7935027.1 hypothetical protein [Chryseobacterium sp.]